MDEIALLRRTRNDIPERSPAEVARGRAALFAAMDDESAVLAHPADAASARWALMSRGAGRQRVVRWTDFSVLGATVVAFTLVAVNVVGIPGVDAGADPAAASVLESAATDTLEFSELTAAPGQYLLVRTDALYLAQGSAPGSERPAAFLENAHDELYVPADRADEWVWIRCVRSPAQTFGPESEAFAALVTEDQAGYDADIIRHFPAGITPGGAAVDGYWNGTTTSDDYDALPRDPAQLLQTIYDINLDTGPSRDAKAFEWVATTLRQGTVPAEVRAAIYKALAEIPDVTITENSATLNGKKGVAIGRLEPSSNTRRDIIIDPTSGQFIGEREVILDGNVAVPASTVMASTAVTTEVVDSAPTDAALCGDYR